MTLLRRDGSPLYHQIGAVLFDQIASGELRIGDRLPSEEEMCRTYRVSRATVRQAMQKLEAQGLIERTPGRGTFVSSAPADSLRERMSLTPDDLDGPLPQHRAVLIQSGVMLPPGYAAEGLGISEAEEVFYLVRVLEGRAGPTAATKTFLRQSVAARLKPGDFEKTDFLGALQRRLGGRLLRRPKRIEAILAETRFATYLNVNIGAPLLSIVASGCFEPDAPVECSHMVYRGDRIRLVADRHAI